VRSWDRASFELNTAPVKRRGGIRPRDVLLPAHHNRLKLLGACIACGISASILYVWMPLLFFSILVNKRIGPQIWLIVLAAACIASTVLFVLASRQMARYREHVAQL
jgi:predicted permease